jgi:hypothetical protein
VFPYSGFQQQVNIRADGGVSGKNVIYKRLNSDGSTTAITRVWRVYARAPEFRPGRYNTAVVEAVPSHELLGLLGLIIKWEHEVGDRKFANVNVDFGGARLGKF